MVKYEVTCGHDHCHFAQEVLLPAEVGQWEPQVVSDLLDGSGAPIVKDWKGQPLEDAYAEHHAEHHRGEPPMCAWRIVE